jgi:hypothetical protein
MNVDFYPKRETWPIYSTIGFGGKFNILIPFLRFCDEKSASLSPACLLDRPYRVLTLTHAGGVLRQSNHAAR